MFHPFDLAQAEAQGEVTGGRLQGAIPLAGVDTGRQYRHAVVAGVTDDLRRRVKAHRLGVQQGAGEDRRVMAFQPAGDIDQKRETGGVGFRKTVIAEAFDLLETTFGEIGVIAIADHAADHFVAEMADGAGFLEGRHGPPQLVGLGRGETGGDDGDFHRLFLEQGHAKGFFQDPAQIGRGIIDVLQAGASAQIGMHHIALNRSRSDNRHLDHQIVKGARFQARQHGHLGAALDLEHAQAVALAQHVVHRPVLGRHGGQIEGPLIMLGQKVKGFAHAAEHAKGQDIDLQNAEGVEIVLIPFDDRALGHRGVFNRHQFIEPAAGHHEAADMLRQMARKADQLARQVERQAQPPIIGVEPQFADARVVQGAVGPAPHLAGEMADDIAGQAHRLAHLAHRAARPIGDHGGGQAGPRAAIFAVDVLNHLLAPLMLEIDVDIGRLVARLADETLEQGVGPFGVDGGDAKAIADCRIGRRAAPLAQDALLAGETDDVVDGQEIGRVVELGDQAQFMVDQHFDLGRQAVRITPGGALPGAMGQFGLHVAPAGGQFVGIFIAQRVEGKATGVGDLDGARDGRRIVTEQTGHFGRRLQIAFGVGGQAIAGVVDGAMVAHTGQNILQGAPLGDMVMDRAGRHQGRAMAARQFGQMSQPGAIPAAVKQMPGEPALPSEQRAKPVQMAGEYRVRTGRRQDQQVVAAAQRGQIVMRQMTVALGRAPFAQAEQARQPAIGGAVLGQGENTGAIDQIEAAGHHITQIVGARRHMAADHPGESVVIGDGQGVVTKSGGGVDQFLRMGGAAQKAEIADRLQFGVAGDRRAHANTPCRYQAGASPRSARPRR